MSTPKTQTNSMSGVVGYGFMGRTHSNAFAKVNQFFDLDPPAGPQGRVRAQRLAM